MHRLFKPKKKKVVINVPIDFSVEKTNARYKDIETIMTVYRMDREIKDLIKDYPADHPLKKDYFQLPSGSCAKDPEKFYLRQEGLQKLLEALQNERKCSL